MCLSSPVSWRIAVGAIGLIAFFALTGCVMADASFLASVDQAFQSAIFPMRNEGLTSVLSFMTDMSGTLVSAVIAVAFTIYLLARIGRREAVAYIICIVAGEVVVKLVKLAAGRVRPIGMNLIEFPADASFPSGHTFAAIAIVSFTIFVLVRTHTGMPKVARTVLAAVAVLWPILIAFTRIYLGVHWPTDILGSFLIGAVAYIPLATYAWDRFIGEQGTGEQGT